MLFNCTAHIITCSVHSTQHFWQQVFFVFFCSTQLHCAHLLTSPLLDVHLLPPGTCSGQVTAVVLALCFLLRVLGKHRRDHPQLAWWPVSSWRIPSDLKSEGCWFCLTWFNCDQNVTSLHLWFNSSCWVHREVHQVAFLFQQLTDNPDVHHDLYPRSMDATSHHICAQCCSYFAPKRGHVGVFYGQLENGHLRIAAWKHL